MLPHMRVTRVRRYAVWLSVAAYFVACPIVFMFAFGIHLGSTAKPSLIETSSLKVTTVPANVQVFLAGRKPERSPVVFDGLSVGSYSISVSANGAQPWRGSLDVRAGIAYVIPQLKMASTRRPISLLSASTATQAVPLRDGHSVAFLAVGGTEIILSTPRGGGLSQERFDLPSAAAQRGVTLSRLDLSGDLAASWQAHDGARWMVALHSSDALPARLMPPRVVPASALAVVSAGNELSDAMIAIEPQALVRYAPSGARSVLVPFFGGLRAYGATRGTLYMLDAAGNVTQYGMPILPAHMGTFALPPVLAAGGKEPWRIVAATEDMVACVSPAAHEFVICAPRGPTVYDGYAGGSPGAARGQFWIWSDDTLFVSRGGTAPHKVAQIDGRILGVHEDFVPQHLAVESDTRLSVLPAISAQESALRFDPVVLFSVPVGARVTACADGVFLVQGAEPTGLHVYKTEWLR